MSAIMNYLRITPQQLKQVQQHPESVLEFVIAVQSVLWEDANPTTILPPYERPVADDLFLDVDKAWHALHFLLNDEAWGGQKPLWDAILGGTPFTQGVIIEDAPDHFVADPDALWEATRYLTPDDVSDVAVSLRAISEFTLRERFNVPALRAAAIYPGNWDTDEAQTELAYLTTAFQDLGTFFQSAAQVGDALLVYLQ